jgi:nucleoside-diphosphate-sugar epimerase
MTILVTGATGFVGLGLIHHLHGLGRGVVGFADREAPMGWWPKGVPLTLGDIRDGVALSRVMADHGVTSVVHGAAITAGPEIERLTPERVIAVNVEGTAALMRAASERGVARVVHASSGSVYPLTKPAAGTFDAQRDPPAPASLYGISKLSAELVAIRLAEVYGITVPVLRLSAVYGAYERDTGVREILSVPAQIMACLARGEEVRLSRPGAGAWLSVRDAAAGLAALLDAPLTGAPVFDLAGPEVFTMADLCAALAQRQPAFRWSLDPDHPTVAYQLPRDRAPSDTTRLTATTGFAPRFGLNEGLDDLVTFAETAAQFPATA